ncbi:RING finger protein 17 [Lagopus muta]|uniref:RING finger protein 17 n=1 Tax=Lagopus muta TaxID=64668 RepID=UPI00209F7818|nr:RING finger protein 17 [Lagopus muta]XP_048790981.1 RING finger protein 17 [Lagopus muta]XP_048790986.1 RING finger protein 17 [Lagopus muta]
MLRGKQENPVDGGNVEEQKRRKLNAVRQCLKILEEDCAGPSCRSDLSCISKELCDVVNNEETDFWGSSSTKTKADVKLGLYDGTSERVARPFRSVTGEKNVQRLVSSSNGQKSDLLLVPPGDTENETVEDIDEALWAGVCNLSCLQDAHEVLKRLELEVKQEGGKVSETLDRKLDELTTCILSRKRKLHAELVKSMDNYSAGIATAKQYIEEKKKCLIGAIRIAKELKITPSVRTYCDLSQVIRDLTFPIDTELSKVKSLKEKTVPRLFLSTDEIILFLQNMGKIEWETSVYESNGQRALALDDREKMPRPDNWLPVENMVPVHKRESKEKALANKLGICDGVKKVKESLPVVPHQNIHAVSKSPSSPDVIIEEIYEDNLEKFPAGNHQDKQRKKLLKKQAYSEHRAGSTELVFVSHVVNPCHFYIQRYSQRREGAFLEMKLNNFCCNKSSYFLASDVLEPGIRAFIKRKETGMWCRGTVTKLIPIKAKNKQKTGGPMRCRVCDIAVIEIFLIDFGSSEVFNFSRYAPADLAALQTMQTDDICLLMRKPDQRIEAELAAIPPLAVLCSLKDIVPKNASEGWGEEAKKIFLGMVNNKAVLMTVFREEDGVLFVDLRKPPCNKICSDMPTSLKDTLVFLDVARFKSHLPNHLENNTVLQCSAPKMPQEREVFSVTVCRINSPSDFYLQLAGSQVDLALPVKAEEIQEYWNSKDKTIACPVEGQACIARHKSGNWYRAQIIGLPHPEAVVVKYIDFGSIANVPLKDIRDTADEFLSFPGKMIKCRLAYIEPCEAAGEWSKATTGRFKEMTEDKSVLCSVVEMLDNILSVELFDSRAACGRGSSINCQLVREDLASYIPGYIKGTPASSKETWDNSLEEIPEKLRALNPVNMKALESQDFRSYSKKELQVIISHVVSPSKIFIQWLSSERKLKSLQEKMDAFYTESQPQSVKWESNMHCAVYVRDLKQWCRGQISRIVSETTAEVLLYDSGAEKTVDISCLRELQEDMKRTETLAIECALADIRPTGGSMQWTATVCECISYCLTGAEAKVVIQETIEGSTLPVKILWKDEAGQLIDFSEHLIEKGLAFRNTRTDKAAVAYTVPVKHPKVHLEQVNSQPSTCNSEPACTRSSSDEQEDINVSKNEQKSRLPLEMNKTYKPPVIPEERNFQAVVSCVGSDGTLYIIPKSSESELKKLMVEIQSNFKCLGLLEPYSWKKEEACVVRGSDSLWYRGKVVEHGGGTLQVQYVDSGCIERVPQCHLHPTTLYTSIPPFCIPCQLYKTTPIGSSWQQDAVDLLQKLLRNEEVEIRVQELPDSPWGKLSICLYFSEMSVSSFMADKKYCVVDDCQEIAKQVLVEGHTPVLPSYKLPPLPVQGDIFPVRITHFVTPKEVYICLNSSENLTKQSATEGDVSCFSELKTLDEALKWCNKYVDSLPLLTDFRTEMPCLVEYEDSLWYRAKLQSVEETDTVKILVQFVDYGNFSVVPTSKLRQIPLHLLKYPVQAVHAMLAGFKPSLCDTSVERIPYCPEWSVKALWTMMDSAEGKQLSASILSLSPEVTIFLYGEEQKLVHMKLIEMGLADLDE